MTKTYFETIKIPTSNVFQNHLDEIHHTIESFCKLNKKYQWAILDAKKGKTAISLDKAEEYLAKNMPESLTYYVVPNIGDEALYIEIKNGVTLNIKNGSFVLYGLFYALINVFDAFKVPLFISVMRRYWIVLSPSFLILSGVLLSLAGLSGWAIFLWIVSGIFIITMAIMILYKIDDESFDFSSYILNTKISYRSYSNKLGVPITQLVTSASSMITFLAGVSTIVSTILLVINQ